MNPSTKDAQYLSSRAEAVVQGIRSSDPSGVWVMQGWLFYNDRRFWDKQTTKNYLAGLKKGDVIILDLIAEVLSIGDILTATLQQPQRESMGESKREREESSLRNSRARSRFLLRAHFCTDHMSVLTT
jgi:hypothetical protein